MAGSDKTITNGEGWRRTGFGSVISAAIALGSLLGYQQIYPPRPDPFTATMAVNLEQRLNRELEIFDQRIDKNEILLDRHRDFQHPPPAWVARIEELELWVGRKDPDYRVPR